MKELSPLGTVRLRYSSGRGQDAQDADGALIPLDEGRLEPAYFGFEIARCAPGLEPRDQRALAALTSACVAAVRSGSTRLPVEGLLLRAALAELGAVDEVASVRSLIERATTAAEGDPLRSVLGRPGERKPLIVERGWLYPERMLLLEQRFCARVRERLAGAPPAATARALGRVLTAVTAGPPSLTDEQKRAVRQALSSSLALISGGPGTGKTTIVVTLLRALAWSGEPMEAIAIAAPTGKAAQRLQSAIVQGLAAAPADIGEAALRARSPEPQTLHRLLGWSPTTARFARHENDPLLYRVVIVDEASMVDLALMDRLLRAIRPDARLILLGDADQLPSVEAGAVFRDLCASVGGARLTVNLRVGTDAAAARIVTAASCVNSGVLDARYVGAVATRRSVRDVAFAGVEHLAMPWAEVGDELLDRWFARGVAAVEEHAARIERVYPARGGLFDPATSNELRVLLEGLGRAKILCATRERAATSVEAMNDAILARLAGYRRGRAGAGWSLPGTLIAVERNDYERRLYNGDQGLVVRVAADGGPDEPMAVFPGREGFAAYPLLPSLRLTPAFATTVHKAQGSEFDDVLLVLPEVDLPLLTRELVYTAMTRARRSVLVVGSPDLLARAVSRAVVRHCGIAERLNDRG